MYRVHSIGIFYGVRICDRNEHRNIYIFSEHLVIQNQMLFLFAQLFTYTSSPQCGVYEYKPSTRIGA